MAQKFEEITKGVVNRFLQNILFIDDKAYQPDNKENEFDANLISSVFAKSGKLCTIFAPSSECDICQCSSLFAKADVFVLDWFLDLEAKNSTDNDEADAEADEPRGFYTRYLIEGIIDDAKDEKLKLIIVYTGETDLDGITESIYKSAKQYGNYVLGDCCVFTSNILILIRAKYNGEEQFKHLENLKSKVVRYEELPDFITSEFAKFSDGLLSNFALLAISSIREQTSKILGVYSNDTDYAYLGHRVLLNNQSDAYQLLIKLFGESMSDLISSSIPKKDEWAFSWVDSRFAKSKTIMIGGKPISVDSDSLKHLLSDGEEAYKEKIMRIFNGKLSGKEAVKNSSCLFSADEASANNSNAKFAILTHHKNIFGVSKEYPILTLGTVVFNSGNYYVCIQQRCDSLRLKDERKFLFLPLLNTDSDIHVVIDKSNHLNVANNSYALKTIKFRPKDGEDCIYAKTVETNGEKRFFFESIYGEEYEWILELKELHAQRIVDAYCSTLSRVGIDESEWLRLLK